MPAPGLLPFAGHKYLNLETFRKNGRGVRTPVWFAASGPISPEHPETFLYVYTTADSGKVKRIRNNPRVRIAPSDARGNVRGEWMDGEARIVDDARESEIAHRLLDAKYWPWKQILGVFGWLRGKPRVVIAIRAV
ncbi:MAG TPA: PPOX class F420-dependent oxidoreductase [Candidatus Dormibacteraeota bacterium]|nr:PPOX class F420-dependent oxidoreductase [Candidatus Dormibacteraeota bacterium]